MSNSLFNELGESAPTPIGDWKKIINAQEADRCVLVIGPEVVAIDGKTLFEKIKESVLIKYKENIKIFPNEQLLYIPKDSPIRNQLRDDLNEFYEECDELNTLYKLVALLPFHLILSLIPHDGLYQTIKNESAYGNNAKFGFQPLKSTPLEVPLPKKEHPLVYNLFPPIQSSNQSEEQPMLTFEDLFDYISGILGSRELPKNLMYSLNKATTFIFLGIPFDYWYTHLLLKKICGINATYLKAYESETLKKNRTFIINNFSMDFVDIAPEKFLKDWYRNLQSKPTNITMKYTEMPIQNGPVSVFISYSHKNINAMLRLKDTLEVAYKKNLIVWADNNLEGGQMWSPEINTQLNKANIIFLILSWEYLRSPYCWHEELKNTLKRYVEGQDLLIVPIIMGKCSWAEFDLPDNLDSELAEKYPDKWQKGLNLANLQAIPKNSDGELLPINQWSSEDDYWTEMFNQIKRIIKKK